jgi:hypothetical protein
MGFFGNLFKTDENKKLKTYEKYGDVLKKTMTTKDQRLEAIQALENLPAQYAIPQLLKRFDLVVESGLLDTREKEMCMKIILTHGENAKDFVKDALMFKTRLAWPIRMAEKLFSQDEYMTLLLNNLNSNMEVFDEDTLERNAEILLALREIPDLKIVLKAEEFLSCRDENVRMAALECIENQASVIGKAKEIILNLVNTPLTDDNSRFLGVVQEISRRHHWI